VNGRSAIGNLEIWDNRSQSAGQAAELAVATDLRKSDQNSGYSDQWALLHERDCRRRIQYFIVEVPRAATIATNTLTGAGDLVLLFNQTGAPTVARTILLSM
jgi:hypothetical protein